MSLFSNSKGVVIQDMQTAGNNSEFLEGLGLTIYMGRECKESSETVKIKNKGRPALKIHQADKTSPVIQTKCNPASFARPFPPGSFFCSDLWKP